MLNVILEICSIHSFITQIKYTLFSSSSMSLLITPAKKGYWNRLDLFIFQPSNKQKTSFLVWTFAFFCVYLLLRDIGQSLYVRALRLLGKIFNLPKKRDKIQKRSELRQQLSSCLLDLVGVHIF